MRPAGSNALSISKYVDARLSLTDRLSSAYDTADLIPTYSLRASEDASRRYTR